MVQEFPEAEGPVGGVDYGRDALPGQRPTGLTVMAVLAWVFGGMAFCCLPFSIVQIYFPISQGPQGNPMEAVYAEMPWIKTFTLVSSLIGMLTSMVLIIGGVGLWKLRRWGWTLLNGYAVFQLLSVLVQAVVNFVFIFPPASEIVGGMPGGEMAVPMLYLSGGCGMAIGALLPVVLLVVINTGAGVRAKPPPGS
jgi:hypothetical protein